MSLTVVEWTIVISLISLVLSISAIAYFMYVRMRQLSNELARLNVKVEITDDEISRLYSDMERFEKNLLRSI